MANDKIGHQPTQTAVSGYGCYAVQVKCSCDKFINVHLGGKAWVMAQIDGVEHQYNESDHGHLARIERAERILAILLEAYKNEIVIQL